MFRRAEVAHIRQPGGQGEADLPGRRSS